MELPMLATQSIQMWLTSPQMALALSQLMQRSEAKLPTIQQGEDIKNYLHQFELLGRSWSWTEEDRSYRLVPFLIGQAREAYLAIDKEQAEVYADLKEELLERFNISPETYRQCFQATLVLAGESLTEIYHHLWNPYLWWVRPELHSREETGEAIILKQLLCVPPSWRSTLFNHLLCTCYSR